MGPRIELDDEAVRENARRWRAHAGVPLWAVVKANGYGWGARRLVEILDGEADGFVVADPDEARAVRPLTARPIAVLAATSPEETGPLLDAGIRPNIASLRALAAAHRWAVEADRAARIRIGLVPAASWAGIFPDEVHVYAKAAAAPGLEIELWTHLTHDSLVPGQRARFAAARAAFEAAGARVVATDTAGTFASAAEGRSADTRTRIGAGLFGVGGEASGPILRCAIRIAATVVDVVDARRVTSSGYREAQRFEQPWLTVVRCGYADGLPARLAGCKDIASVGMQYAVLARREREHIGAELSLLDTSGEIRAFLDGRVPPHEFIVGLHGGT